MLETKEIRAIAQKVVDISKASSNRDTGFLRRSISYTVEKDVYIFVEVFYGQFGADRPSGINSKLEINAKRLMPSGVKWRMRYTDINRSVLADGSIQTGRNSLDSIIGNLKQSTTAVKNLIDRIKNSKIGRTQISQIEEKRALRKIARDGKKKD
jgi:hypothetical protein